MADGVVRLFEISKMVYVVTYRLMKVERISVRETAGSRKGIIRARGMED